LQSMVKNDIINDMKRFLAVFCISLFMFSLQGLLGALELELKGGVNGMTFDPDKVNQTEKIEPFLGITGNLALKIDISKECSFGLYAERDNLFHNNADIRLKTRLDYFGFEFGIFAGLTDFSDSFHMGVLGHMEVTFPNILFFQAGGSSTIGSQFDFMSDVIRQSVEAKLGFYIPYVITVISAEMKSFSWYPTHDNLYRIKLSADISFGKTSAFALRVDGGYQILSRKYMAANDKTDKLSTGFAGLDFQFDVGKYLRFSIGGEMPFLPVAQDPVKAPEDFYMMFKAYAGMIIKFF